MCIGWLLVTSVLLTKPHTKPQPSHTNTSRSTAPASDHLHSATPPQESKQLNHTNLSMKCLKSTQCAHATPSRVHTHLNTPLTQITNSSRMQPQRPLQLSQQAKHAPLHICHASAEDGGSAGQCMHPSSAAQFHVSPKYAPTPHGHPAHSFLLPRTGGGPREVYQGMFGPWSIEPADEFEVWSYRVGLTATAVGVCCPRDE